MSPKSEPGAAAVPAPCGTPKPSCEAPEPRGCAGGCWAPGPPPCTGDQSNQLNLPSKPQLGVVRPPLFTAEGEGGSGRRETPPHPLPKMHPRPQSPQDPADPSTAQGCPTAGTPPPPPSRGCPRPEPGPCHSVGTAELTLGWVSAPSPRLSLGSRAGAVGAVQPPRRGERSRGTPPGPRCSPPSAGSAPRPPYLPR